VYEVGKYEQLRDHLKGEREELIRLTFSEIEEILGFSLPKSAYEYRAWWANDGNHVQARDGWISAGYNSEAVDLDNHRVSFRRVGDPVIESPSLEELSGKEMTAVEFEKFAQIRMSQHYKVNLSHGKKDDWPKLFDMVSDDYTIVGDAKYLSMVRGQYLPPAKLSVISEHVWMLEKLNADKKFLIFGNDIRVPQEWLKRYKRYVDSVEFYFLSNDGKLTILLEAD